MAKQKIEANDLDEIKRALAFLIDQAPRAEQPAAAKPARTPAKPQGSASNWLITFVLVVITIIAVRMLAQIAIEEWTAWNAPTQPTTVQEQPTFAPLPPPVQPAYNPAPVQPAAEQPIIAQPEPQPAVVAQPEPSAPQVVEVRPTSEQYIVENGQFVLAAEPAPTVVPGSAGPGGSSGGSTWGAP